MKRKAFGVGLLSVSLLFVSAGIGLAQAPPPPPPPPPTPGFVPPYEIVHTLRSAGFDPLAPPLREGTTYVLRATDYRGILMRVVVDARTGAIRDVTRIVPGPGSYGPVGLGAQPYGASPYYGPPPYRLPIYNEPGNEAELPSSDRPETHVPPHPAMSAPLPLPRPRPAEIAVRKPVDETKPGATSNAKPDVAPSAKIDSAPSVKTDTAPSATSSIKSGGTPAVDSNVKDTLPATAATKPDAKSDITTVVVPTPAPVKPGKQAPVPLND